MFVNEILPLCFRYPNTSIPSFSSPPHSPLVGLVFDSNSNYSESIMSDRNLNSDRRSQNTWSNSNQEPIGTGAKKKIVKNQDKRTFTNDLRYIHDRYKDGDSDRQRKDRTLGSESASSLDFFVDGERMVSELCNIPETTTSRSDSSYTNQNRNSRNDEDKSKIPDPSDILLTALDKIVIHDQIPNQIVQLAIEACTDAENIAIAHHNRPCFKNIHSICAKTRSNVQKPDSAVANLHSQGIPWVIKNFIFSFVRILDGWKGVKELLSEKHETFSRIENKYYSPNIRECFVQWQAVTKEMLTHIYRTFKCLDHGFTMEQKSFTHNYYATNSAGPRHQSQNKFQPIKPHASGPRLSTASPQSFNVVQPPWVQNQNPTSNQNYNENAWPPRTGIPCKKMPVISPSSSQMFFPLNEQSEVDSFQKTQYKEAKPRQSWTITNMADFRAFEGLCHADQREIYAQLKHKIDAELGKTQSQPSMSNLHYDMLQRREMELKSKMIPLSHVEKTLIPSMTGTPEIRGCYMQRNNSCGDTKEEDFFAAWGQMVQKESSEFITHQSHNIQVTPNVVTISNISGPVQYIDHENDEFHEISKVYMKPGSYKVPIKPDPVTPFIQGTTTPDVVYENPVTPEVDTLKVKVPFPNVTLAPYPKYNLESWPCLIPRRAEDIFSEEQKQISGQNMTCIDLRRSDSLDLLSSMTSDRAWEAAKQSAPKLLDFIHEGSKSDTARLYDALGFNNTGEEYQENTAHETWPTGHYLSKDISHPWDQDSTDKRDVQTYTEDSFDHEDQIELSLNKNDTKEKIRCPHFDQAGSYVRDDNQKKNSSKQKTSGNWYHPKKKKPLPASIIKKFELILKNLSEFEEAKFIQDDMDIKVVRGFI